jgi:hypothetical protein
MFSRGQAPGGSAIHISRDLTIRNRTRRTGCPDLANNSQTGKLVHTLGKFWMIAIRYPGITGFMIQVIVFKVVPLALLG